MGQNYLRSLLALAFQGFLIIICIAIYAVLVQNMLIDDNISTAIWLCMGYGAALLHPVQNQQSRKVNLQQPLGEVKSTWHTSPYPKT